MSAKFQHLLSPLSIQGRIVKNRMTAGNFKKHFIQGPEEYPTENVITHFVNKAKNGAGMVLFPGVEFASRRTAEHYMPPYNVSAPMNQHYVCQVVDGCHLFGALCIGFIRFQLPSMSPGTLSGNETEFYDVSDKVLSQYIMGDPMCEKFGQHYSRPYTKDMIAAAVDTAVEHAKVMKELGFDGIHLAMPRFLSLRTNKRGDEYGGSLENRLRIFTDTFARIKQECGRDFLIETVVNIPEREEPVGWTLDDAVRACILLEGYADIVNVWGYDIDERHVTQFEPVTPYLEAAAAVKAGLKGRENPVVIQVMGGFQNPAVMDEAIAEGKTDLISMARAFIADPEYGKKVYEGREEDIVPCLRCNKCHRTSNKDPYLDSCSVNPAWGYEHKIDRLFDKPDASRRVGVIGGGPAGMRVAIMLTERGHKVSLYEKTDRLGGLLNCANRVPFKWPLKDYKDYLIRQTYKHGVDVRLNCAPTVEQLRRERFDYVVAAIGSEPVMPPIPGIDGDNVISAVDAYDHLEKLGRKIVIVGGGEIGVETGMYLSELGHDVTVLEMTDTMAADCTPTHYRALFMRAWEKDEAEHGLVLTVNAKVTAISAGGVTYVDAEGSDRVIPADTVVISAGLKPKSSEAMAYCTAGDSFYMLGDCRQVSNLLWLNKSALGIAGLI